MAEDELARAYIELKDLRVSLNQGEEDSTSSKGFCLCMWLYLSGSVTLPTVILRQIHSDTKDEVPFLVLNKENKVTLFSLTNIRKEASPDGSCSLSDIPCVLANIEFPLEKWVHVGCEVTTNYTRLHVDGVVVGEKPLTFECGITATTQDTSKGITISGNDGDAGELQVYTYGVQIFTSSSSIHDHIVKTPPIQLALDSSCISNGIEEDSDGIWSVVGGKASCCRSFSLEVILLDALGHHVHNDMEVLASLVYADNRHPVEKPKDDPEALLLGSCDGLEFPSTERPVKLTNGCASVKLKISQLSSKCDNRLFRVHFYSSNPQRYPFLDAYSPVIRCISRSCNTRASPGLGRKLSSIALLRDVTVSPGGNERSPEDNYGDGQFQISTLQESKCIPPSKRLKVRHDKLQKQIEADGTSQQKNNGCNSIALTDETAIKRCLGPTFENFIRTENEPSDSESTDARSSSIKGPNGSRTSISDAAVFKYCIEGADERSMLLKEAITYSSDQDMADFAERVSLYTGCAHHGYQVLIARQLIQEVVDSWNLISQGNHRVLWRDAVSAIERKFIKITRSDTRGLSGQDLEVLKRIAGCGDAISREGFDKIWYWLYPVAYALSKEPLKAMWECTSPRWFEGLITKEEAEGSVRGPNGLQKSGTFVLRFPTSRSWPHPDAGSLVITYVGHDGNLHNKLLSLDNREGNRRPLQDLLLEESELTQLGRVTRLVTPSDFDEV